MGDCIKSNLERVGKNGKNYRRIGECWQRTYVVREKWEGEKRQWKRKSWSTHPWRQWCPKN